jgi:hypothetical protein
VLVVGRSGAPGTLEFPKWKMECSRGWGEVGHPATVSLYYSFLPQKAQMNNYDSSEESCWAGWLTLPTPFAILKGWEPRALAPSDVVSVTAMQEARTTYTQLDSNLLIL